jgi:hypothetical protein
MESWYCKFLENVDTLRVDLEALAFCGLVSLRGLQGKVSRLWSDRENGSGTGPSALKSR